MEQGDRVVAYLPNVPAAVVGLLACASLGAVWSACAPDIGPQSAVDRFGQLDPRVLITTDGYRFGGVDRDRRDAVAELRAGLPTLEAVVHVPFARDLPDTPGVGRRRGRAGRRPSGATARGGAVVGRVLLRHDRAAEGPGAQPRRRGC